MKVFKKVRAYVGGKGIVQTDVVFDDKIRAFHVAGQRSAHKIGVFDRLLRAVAVGEGDLLDVG